MKFRVLLHKKADEFLKRISLGDKRRIVNKLKQLEDFPTVKFDIVKIAGEQEKIVVVVKIDTRKRIYQ
ncbi:hypothetical protein KEJ21_04615 [Candidatus Bathyarchaeota archaeon]|nr:hypothetical protein [Candidatus Bathyarchaeota archaeon]MBS7631004.1 hypothetical protein [Candidatus Bathyarchaeota archaeon]